MTKPTIFAALVALASTAIMSYFARKHLFAGQKVGTATVDGTVNAVVLVDGQVTHQPLEGIAFYYTLLEVAVNAGAFVLIFVAMLWLTRRLA